jgi:hypothetical protein
MSKTAPGFVLVPADMRKIKGGGEVHPHNSISMENNGYLVGE